MKNKETVESCRSHVAHHKTGIHPTDNRSTLLIPGQKHVEADLRASSFRLSRTSGLRLSARVFVFTSLPVCFFPRFCSTWRTAGTLQVTAPRRHYVLLQLLPSTTPNAHPKVLCTTSLIFHYLSDHVRGQLCAAQDELFRCHVFTSCH